MNTDVGLAAKKHQNADFFAPFAPFCGKRVNGWMSGAAFYFVGSTILPINKMLPLPLSRIKKMNG